MKKKAKMQSIKRVVLTKKFNSNVEEEIHTEPFVVSSARIMLFPTRRRIHESFPFLRSIRWLTHEREPRRTGPGRNSQVSCGQAYHNANRSKRSHTQGSQQQRQLAWGWRKRLKLIEEAQRRRRLHFWSKQWA